MRKIYTILSVMICVLIVSSTASAALISTKYSTASNLLKKLNAQRASTEKLVSANKINVPTNGVELKTVEQIKAVKQTTVKQTDSRLTTLLAKLRSLSSKKTVPNNIREYNTVIEEPVIETIPQQPVTETVSLTKPLTAEPKEEDQSIQTTSVSENTFVLMGTRSATGEATEPSLIFVGDEDGTVYAYKKEIYLPVWSVKAHNSYVSELIVDGNNLYSAGGDGKVIKWDKKTGAYDVLADINAEIYSMELVNGYLFVGTAYDEGNVYKINIANKEIVDSAKVTEDYDVDSHEFVYDLATDGTLLYSASSEITREFDQAFDTNYNLVQRDYRLSRAVDNDGTYTYSNFYLTSGDTDVRILVYDDGTTEKEVDLTANDFEKGYGYLQAIDHDDSKLFLLSGLTGPSAVSLTALNKNDFSLSWNKPFDNGDVLFYDLDVDNAFVYAAGDDGKVYLFNKDTGDFTSPINVGNELVSVAVDSTTNDYNEPPTINSVSVPSNLEENVMGAFSVTASDVDGSIVSYEWSFGDGATSSLASPNHLYYTAGTYDVTVTVTDNGGKSVSETRSITISDTTSPTTTITTTQTITNQAEFKVEFSSPDGDTQSFEVSSDGSTFSAADSFTNHNFTLTEGENTLYVRAVDEIPNKGTADSITVTLDTEEPSLVVDEPEAYTNSDSITLSFTSVDADHYEVFVDNDWVNIGQSTTHTFSLEEGENSLSVKAVDLAGNENISTKIVTYDNEVPKIDLLTFGSPGYVWSNLNRAVSDKLVFEVGDLEDVQEVKVSFDGGGTWEVLDKNTFELVGDEFIGGGFVANNVNYTIIPYSVGVDYDENDVPSLEYNFTIKNIDSNSEKNIVLKGVYSDFVNQGVTFQFEGIEFTLSLSDNFEFSSFDDDVFEGYSVHEYELMDEYSYLTIEAENTAGRFEVPLNNFEDNKDYELVIQVTDRSGNINTKHHLFNTDYTNPVVNSITPISDYYDVAEPVTITWDAYDINDIGYVGVYLEKNTPVPGGYTSDRLSVDFVNDANEWTFNPGEYGQGLYEISFDINDGSQENSRTANDVKLVKQFIFDEVTQFVSFEPVETTNETALFNFTTSELVDVSINYGVTDTTENSVTQDSADSFELTLSALQPDTTYTYEIVMTDEFGNTATEQGTFQTQTSLNNNRPVALFTVDNQNPYEKETQVNFNATDSFDEDGSIVSYSWDFGDGNTATGNETEHTYQEAGVYTVALTVTDDDGETGTRTLDVYVHPQTADLEITNIDFVNDVIQPGEPLQYNITIKNNGGKDTENVRLMVINGDDDVLYVDVPGYSTIYAIGSLNENIPGLYSVDAEIDVGNNVQETNEDNNDMSKGFRVNSAPTADFEVTGQLYAGFPLEFESTSTDDAPIASYAWDFGDGTTETGAVVNHAYLTNNTYIVTLTVTDADGVSDSITKEVVVEAGTGIKPTLVMNVPEFVEINVPFTIDTTGSNDDLGIYYYDIDFGDSTNAIITYPNLVDVHPHTYDNIGYYRVNVTATDFEGLTDSQETLVATYDPNLGVELVSDGITFNNTTPVAGDNVQVTARFYNLGGATATNANFTLYDDLNSFTPIKETRTIVNATYEEVVFNWVAVGGSRNIIIEAEEYSGETITVDNLGTKAIVVEGNTTALPPVAGFDIYGPRVMKWNNAFILEQSNTSTFNSTATTPQGTIFYAWNFGNGAIAGNYKEYDYAYPEIGRYWTTHTVTNNDGFDDTISKEIFVMASQTQPASGNSFDFAGTLADPTTDAMLDISPYNWTPDNETNGYNILDDQDMLFEIQVFNFGAVATPGANVSLYVNNTYFGSNLIDVGSGFGSSVNTTNFTIPANLLQDGENDVTINVAHALNVEDDPADGINNETTWKVIVDPKPNAVFTASRNSLTAGGSVSFNATNSNDNNAITSYGWDFGDGSTATGAEVSHTFTSAGTRTVTLTVTDNAGQTNSETTQVTVSAVVVEEQEEKQVVRRRSSSSSGGGSLYVPPTPEVEEPVEVEEPKAQDVVKMDIKKYSSGDLSISRDYYYLADDNSTVITLKVVNDGDETKAFVLTEKIPKEFAGDVSEISFSPEPDHIFNEDPVVGWDVELEAGENFEVAMEFEKEISEGSVKMLSAPEMEYAEPPQKENKEEQNTSGATGYLTFSPGDVVNNLISMILIIVIIGLLGLAWNHAKKNNLKLNLFSDGEVVEPTPEPTVEPTPEPVNQEEDKSSYADGNLY